jgi:hypothetical protein
MKTEVEKFFAAGFAPAALLSEQAIFRGKAAGRVDRTTPA